MNFKKYHVSKNLFYKTVATLNYYVNSSTGDLVGNAAYFASDYIEVEQGEEYYWNDAQRGNAGAFYDSNKTYISGWSSSQTRYVFTVPSGAKYVRLTGEKAGIDAYMLSKGSEALPYEPYSSEVWHDIPYYLHNTSTDTITTLPADIYANAATATVGLKGQSVQSGTPSPQSPVMPNGCGERTGNLLNLNLFAEKYEGKITFDNGIFDVSVASQDMYTTGISVDIPANTTFSCENVTKENQSLRGRIKFVFDDNTTQDVLITLSDGTTAQNPVVSFAKAIIAIRLDWSTFNGGFSFKLAMLNSGSTALPYEPYGVKIPISSNGTTTPVYLGEVQTTRRVKKLVLDGTENWSGYSSSASGIGVSLLLSDMLSNSRDNGFCTHFSPQYSPSQSTIDGVTFGAGNKALYLTFSVASATALNLTDTTSVKTWLAAQYANGTPVSVWYVLATEETAVVNDPLMCIGNYADEVSNVSIPVTAGGDTISVGTTVQPSEITANYKGWHPKTPKESNNGQWS